MIIIRRPNPAFLGNVSPYGIDTESASKQTASLGLNDDGMQPCRRFVLVPSDIGTTTEVDKHEPTEKIDHNVIVEENRLHCHETSAMTTLLMDVSSFKPDQLKVQIENHVLTISGHRTNKLGDIFVTHRRFALQTDTYDEEKIVANFDDGILAITIQKKSSPKCRQISIRVATNNTSGKLASESSSKDVIETKLEECGPNEDEVSSTKKAAPEKVSVETVNEGDEDEDTRRPASKIKVETNGTNEESSTSSTKSHNDLWEKIVKP